MSSDVAVWVPFVTKYGYDRDRDVNGDSSLGLSWSEEFGRPANGRVRIRVLQSGVGPHWIMLMSMTSMVLLCKCLT